MIRCGLLLVLFLLVTARLDGQPLIDAIVDRFDLLAEQPAVGRARPDFGVAVRSFVVESYVINYRVEDEVLIARVLHGHGDHSAAWTD
jgi:plasmid stabilization system protein ParE